MLVTNGLKNTAEIAIRTHPHSMRGARNMKSKKLNMKIARAKHGKQMHD